MSSSAPSYTLPYTSTTTARHDPLEYHLDELPSYDEADRAPAYSREESRDEGRGLDGSALVFSLRQLSRKKQAFVSMGPPLNIIRGANRFTEVDSSLTLGHLDLDLPYPWNSTSREFIIDHKSGAGFSKNKPDFVITATDREQRRGSVPPPRRRSSLFRISTTRDASPERDLRRGSIAGPIEAGRQSQPIASIRYARSGPLPWTPRATITYEQAFVEIFGHDGHLLDGNRQQDMELKRSSANGWTISIFDHEYAWCLLASPIRLALVDLESETIKASFVYSDVGTFAGKDGEVGRLSVPLQSLPNDSGGERGRSGLQDGFMEYVICSLSAALVHWRNEGKALFNPSTTKVLAPEEVAFANGHAVTAI